MDSAQDFFVKQVLIKGQKKDIIATLHTLNMLYEAGKELSALVLYHIQAKKSFN